MNIAAGLVAELQHELPITRKHLERIPDDKLDWKPHDKSMSCAELASHIAESMSWTSAMTDMDEFDLDPETYEPFKGSTSAAILAAFDENTAIALDKIAGVDDEAMFKTWKMTSQGQTLFEMPRVVVIRNMAISHMIHHRAQLGVYLRLNDIDVPETYGPSADEGEMFGG